MKTAGNRLRLGAVALLSMIVVALVAPVATSAYQQQPATGSGGKCYEQVLEYRYQRPTYSTEYELTKFTRERTGNTSAWSEWTPVNGVSYWSANQNEVNEGHLEGNHNHPNKWDRDYKYFWDGTTTRQVESGSEETDWLTAPPAGEGWVQIDQRQGKREVECPPWQKVNICHATGSDSNPYTTNEVSYRSINNEYEIDWNGHGNHAGDIIPAFGNFPGQGDTSLLQYGDCQRPKPEQPTFPPEVVETYGNCATGDGVATGTRTTTSFKAVFNAATWAWEKVQDGDPVIEQISRPLTADEQNSCRPSKEPVVERTDVGTPECGDTTIQVKVTTTTYSFTYSQQTKSWDESASTNVTYETRPLTAEEQFPCPPGEWAKPTWNPICGADNDSMTIPNDSADVDYQDGGWSNGKRTVTAVWTYDNSVLDSWTFTDHNVSCPPGEWPQPTHEPVCGPDNDTVNVPADTDEVRYTSTGWKDGINTVTASWTADDSVLDSWKLTDDNVSCPPVQWAEPSAQPVCGVDNDSVTVPSGTDAVSYTDTGWVNGTRTVTATWNHDDSELDSWEFTDDGQACPPVEWAEPSAQPVCGVDNDSVTVPSGTDAVTYADTGWVNGTRTVTATWNHDDSELDSWKFTDAGEACPPTTEPPTTVAQSLDIVAMGPVCQRDAPYIEVTFGDQPQFNGRTATVTFIDLDGNVVGTETATYAAGAAVRFVYPGATVDAAGNAVDWPGWMYDGNVWVHDPSDAHLRDGLTVVVEVNPTARGSVSYPEATAGCADAPTVSSSGPTPPTTPAPATPAPTTTDPVVPQGGLPVTR